MKSIVALFVVFYLLRDANIICARKDLDDYWKNTMMNQPMPESIQDLIQDPRVTDAGKNRFIRDFDIKPNLILYHTHHVVSTKQKPFVRDHKPEFKKSDAMVEQTMKKG